MALTAKRRPEHGRRDLLLLILVVAAGALLGALSPGYRLYVTEGLRGSVLLPILETHEFLASRAQGARRITALRARRDSLARALATVRAEAAEARSLRAVVGVGPETSGDFVVAQIRPGGARFGEVQTFLLGVGRDQGVEPPAGVVTPDGLLGVVRSATGRTSRGEFWTHPDFRISVRTPGGEATGIVRPTPGAEPPVMLLEGAPFQEEIAVGTPLVTTGLAGIYPPGVRVGVVREVARVESGWERSYRVQPAIRPGEIDVALIWVRPGAER